MSDDIEEPEVLDLLPDLDLPEHKGRVPVAMSTSLTGASSRTGRAHTLDDVVVLVIEAKVADVGHKTTKKGLIYHERYDVQDAFELQADSAQAVLSGARIAYRQADDARHGRTPLIPESKPSKLVWADASGYVLGDDDLAEIRGEGASDDELEEQRERDAAKAEALDDAAGINDVLHGDTAVFDKLTVAQVSAALVHVDDTAVLGACEEHELANGARKGVLKALRARTDELEAELRDVD